MVSYFFEEKSFMVILIPGVGSRIRRLVRYMEDTVEGKMNIYEQQYFN